MSAQIQERQPVLRKLAEGVWTADLPEHKFFGLALGTRMSVVELGSGALWVHSPVRLTSSLRASLDALGRVTHIVAPNLYHHMYAGDFQSAYPDARLHAPEGLLSKRTDLRIDHPLGERHQEWADRLEPLTIEGSMLGETVFVHRPSGTLITSDLTENFSRMSHTPTRWYLQAGGIWKKIGFSRFLRPVYRDHVAARRSIDALLERTWDRVVVAHGDVIESDGKDAVRRTFEFLRA